MRLIRRHGMGKTIEVIIAKAVPIYLIDQVIPEVRLANKRMFTARSVRRRLVSKKGSRINIGCGISPTQGWINLDIISHPGVFSLGLPVRLAVFRWLYRGDLLGAFFRAS